MVDQEYSPSFLVSVVATTGGNLTHVPPGKHVLSAPLWAWYTRALVCASCPTYLVLPVKKQNCPDPSVVLSMSFYHQL